VEGCATGHCAETEKGNRIIGMTMKESDFAAQRASAERHPQAADALARPRLDGGSQLSS
jgi:hypothetical protein